MSKIATIVIQSLIASLLPLIASLLSMSASLLFALKCSLSTTARNYFGSIHQTGHRAWCHRVVPVDIYSGVPMTCQWTESAELGCNSGLIYKKVLLLLSIWSCSREPVPLPAWAAVFANESTEALSLAGERNAKPIRGRFRHL